MLSRSRTVSMRYFHRCFSSQTLANKHILISNALGDELPKDAVEYMKDKGANVDIMKRNLQINERTPELLNQVKSKAYDALYVCLEDIVNEEIINAASPSLQIVSTMSVGYNHIDINKCKQLNIRVGYTPQVLTETTADLVLALTLATARKLIPANKTVYDGSWGAWTPLFMAGKDVYGSTVGIVGLGRIGLAVAKRFKGFECDVIYCNSSGKENNNAKAIGARFVNFEELLSSSDYVIPLCPLSPQTKHLFKDEQFRKMKNDAVFINASRGDVVCQDSLARALSNGEIMSAGLDVTSPEPIPLDHELLKQENCIILPHIGSGSVATRTKMAMIAAQNIENVFKGEEPIYSVC
eukprot:1154272_1